MISYEAVIVQLQCKRESREASGVRETASGKVEGRCRLTVEHTSRVVVSYAVNGGAVEAVGEHERWKSASRDREGMECGAWPWNVGTRR